MILRLKHARQIADKTQEQMAQLLGVDKKTYRTWEANAGKITMENAHKIAEILGREIDEIVWRDRTGGEK